MATFYGKTILVELRKKLRVRGKHKNNYVR